MTDSGLAIFFLDNKGSKCTNKLFIGNLKSEQCLGDYIAYDNMQYYSLYDFLKIAVGKKNPYTWMKSIYFVEDNCCMTYSDMINAMEKENITFSEKIPDVKLVYMFLKGQIKEIVRKRDEEENAKKKLDRAVKNFNDYIHRNKSGWSVSEKITFSEKLDSMINNMDIININEQY